VNGAARTAGVDGAGVAIVDALRVDAAARRVAAVGRARVVVVADERGVNRLATEVTAVDRAGITIIHHHRTGILDTRAGCWIAAEGSVTGVGVVANRLRVHAAIHDRVATGVGRAEAAVIAVERRTGLALPRRGVAGLGSVARKSVVTSRCAVVRNRRGRRGAGVVERRVFRAVRRDFGSVRDDRTDLRRSLNIELDRDRITNAGQHRREEAGQGLRRKRTARRRRTDERGIRRNRVGDLYIRDDSGRVVGHRERVREHRVCRDRRGSGLDDLHVGAQDQVVLDAEVLHRSDVVDEEEGRTAVAGVWECRLNVRPRRQRSLLRVSECPPRGARRSDRVGVQPRIERAHLAKNAYVVNIEIACRELGDRRVRAEGETGDVEVRQRLEEWLPDRHLDRVRVDDAGLHGGVAARAVVVRTSVEVLVLVTTTVTGRVGNEERGTTNVLLVRIGLYDDAGARPGGRQRVVELNNRVALDVVVVVELDCVVVRSLRRVEVDAVEDPVLVLTRAARDDIDRGVVTGDRTTGPERTLVLIDAVPICADRATRVRDVRYVAVGTRRRVVGGVATSDSVTDRSRIDRCGWCWSGRWRRTWRNRRSHLRQRIGEDHRIRTSRQTDGDNRSNPLQCETCAHSSPAARSRSRAAHNGRRFSDLASRTTVGGRAHRVASAALVCAYGHRSDLGLR